MDLSFKDPPINELVMGVYFNPLFNLRAEHIGIFFDRVRKEFPMISQQPPIGSIIDGPGEVFPLPRFWFVAKDEATLLQVQKNAFLFNWRKRDHSYPHYESLKRSFDNQLLDFQEFLRTETGATDLVVEVCELTYINVIGPTDYWSGPRDTAKVIPTFTMGDLPGCKEAPEFNQVTAFKIGDSVALNFSVKSGRLGADPRLIFEFKATGRPNGNTKRDIDSWFDAAHKVIRDSFLHLTSKDIQERHWQVVDGVQ